MEEKEAASRCPLPASASFETTPLLDGIDQKMTSFADYDGNEKGEPWREGEILSSLTRRPK